MSEPRAITADGPELAEIEAELHSMQDRPTGAQVRPCWLAIRLADSLRAAIAARDAEAAIVDRIWTALGISTYEQAKGLAIDEIVNNLKAERDLHLETVKKLMKQAADVEAERHDYECKMKTYWKLVQDLEAEREGWQQETNDNHESARRIMNERDAALQREQAANDRARIHRDCKNAWLNRAQAAEAERDAALGLLRRAQSILLGECREPECKLLPEIDALALSVASRNAEIA